MDRGYMARRLVGAVASLSIFLVPLVAQADQEHKIRVIETCESFAQLAENTMEIRQLGAPVRNALVDDNAGPSKEIVNEMVLRAYEYPQMQSEPARNILIKDFAAQEYQECMKRFSS